MVRIRINYLVYLLNNETGNYEFIITTKLNKEYKPGDNFIFIKDKITYFCVVDLCDSWNLTSEPDITYKINVTLIKKY